MGTVTFMGFAVSAVAAGYLALLAGLRANEDRLLLHPRRKSPDMGVALRCRVTDWMPEGRYAGLIVDKPEGDFPFRGTVLIFHGNAGDAEGRIPLAAQFAHLGYRAVIAEYPGFGRRNGKPELTGALAACKDALEQVLKTWSGTVTLCGESLGGGMAGQVLAADSANVTAVIFATPWDSLTAVASARMPFVPVGRMLRHPFDTVKALQNFDKPVVVIASEGDRLIPVRHARALAGSVGHSVYVPLHAGHNDWFRAIDSSHWRVVETALNSVP